VVALQKGAKVNAQGGHYGTALQRVSHQENALVKQGDPYGPKIISRL